MKIDKTKQQKKLERYFMQPNYQAYLGLTVTKDTDVQDEEITEDENFKKTVRQKIKGLKFVTETIVERTYENGIKKKEKSTLELDLLENTRLIWVEGMGYMLPSENFKTIKEISQDLENLKPLDIGE